ncbi:head-tail connector protein [Mycobacterium phage SirDuracell]|uniref:Head-to-tail connector protein n=11 Tax=Kostyavirus TaxID=1623284 RepID=G1DHV0_9CAUD|nr:head-tail connector protein [Mycobacterium phage Kostya]YP_008052186.1 head-tail connector protein [Mycobacterium phage Phaux]YP_008410031.1 head-tail connector protein [Mycobacterium phage Contagion]YP_008430530.1 head-tail connector protein [Mycobacterium phage Goku]YP_008857500.1 head-tail connector protein [Mycobacterium phage PhatBacter]YP_008858293.1 head-tail connector protein [Mycobacterium phage Nala]YP_008858741.1 head-tail connector protein [Mycobacterium phage HufflyPuff]YP_00
MPTHIQVIDAYHGALIVHGAVTPAKPEPKPEPEAKVVEDEVETKVVQRRPGRPKKSTAGVETK